MKNPESVDISLVRNINSRAVLDSIFNSDITSRTILAKQLGMSKSSVSSNLAGLIERGIVLEIGEGESSVVGGRKPQLLTFNKNHKYILAIDLNMTSPLFVLGNLRGEQLGEFSVHIEEGITQEAYLSMMENAVNLLLASRGMIFFLRAVFLLRLLFFLLFAESEVPRREVENAGPARVRQGALRRGRACEKRYQDGGAGRVDRQRQENGQHAVFQLRPGHRHRTDSGRAAVRGLPFRRGRNL